MKHKMLAVVLAAALTLGMAVPASAVTVGWRWWE